MDYRQDLQPSVLRDIDTHVNFSGDSASLPHPCRLPITGDTQPSMSLPSLPSFSIFSDAQSVWPNNPFQYLTYDEMVQQKPHGYILEKWKLLKLLFPAFYDKVTRILNSSSYTAEAFNSTVVSSQSTYSSEYLYSNYSSTNSTMLNASEDYSHATLSDFPSSSQADISVNLPITEDIREAPPQYTELQPWRPGIVAPLPQSTSYFADELQFPTTNLPLTSSPVASRRADTGSASDDSLLSNVRSPVNSISSAEVEAVIDDINVDVSDLPFQ